MKKVFTIVMILLLVCIATIGLGARDINYGTIPDTLYDTLLYVDTTSYMLVRSTYDASDSWGSGNYATAYNNRNLLIDGNMVFNLRIWKLGSEDSVKMNLYTVPYIDGDTLPGIESCVKAAIVTEDKVLAWEPQDSLLPYLINYDSINFIIRSVAGNDSNIVQFTVGYGETKY